MNDTHVKCECEVRALSVQDNVWIPWNSVKDYTFFIIDGTFYLRFLLFIVAFIYIF